MLGCKRDWRRCCSCLLLVRTQQQQIVDIAQPLFRFPLDPENQLAFNSLSWRTSMQIGVLWFSGSDELWLRLCYNDYLLLSHNKDETRTRPCPVSLESKPVLFLIRRGRNMFRMSFFLEITVQIGRIISWQYTYVRYVRYIRSGAKYCIPLSEGAFWWMDTIFCS